jgi:hypothetical protein
MMAHEGIQERYRYPLRLRLPYVPNSLKFWIFIYIRNEKVKSLSNHEIAIFYGVNPIWRPINAYTGTVKYTVRGRTDKHKNLLNKRYIGTNYIRSVLLPTVCIP